MSSLLTQFLRDALRDSATLEQAREPGQAFDKLARGIEALLPDQEGQSQKEKACSYFSKRVMDEEVWSVMVSQSGRVRYFAEELSYYLGDAARSEGRQFQRCATEFGQAVSATDRQVAALRLADLCMLLRNKRFHGHPAFSGRNIRVALSAEAFLAILRSCLQRELAGVELGEAAGENNGDAARFEDG